MKDLKRNLAVAILFLLGLYFLQGPQGTSTKSNIGAGGETQMSSQKMNWSAAEKSIDNHLKSGRFAEELRKEAAQVENQLQAPTSSAQNLDPIVYTNEKEPIPIVVGGEDPGARIYQENNPVEASQRYNSLTPEQRVNKKINRDQFARDYQQQQEEAFMKQYIENARRAGYELKLNAKGEVVDYREIGSDEPLRFPQSVSPEMSPSSPTPEAKSQSGR